MKNYDETVDTVFERIRAYNVKKKARAVLTRRIAVSCCAVSLLGGGVWYLGTPRHDIPVTAVLNEDEVTTTTDSPTTTDGITATVTGDVITLTTATTTVAPTPPEGSTTSDSTTGKTEPSKTTTTKKTDAPTATTTVTTTQTTTKPSASTTQSTATPTTPTTAPQKIVITADEPDVYGDASMEILSRNEKYISPALLEKMKLYENKDVLYSVIVEIPLTIEDYEECSNYSNTNEEVIRLATEKAAAYDAYLKAKEQAGGWTQEVYDKYQIFKEIASQHTGLYNKLTREYTSVIRNRRTVELSSLSNNALISLATDTRFIPYFSYDSNYAFFMELTADQINEVAELGGYVIRLVFPDGDQPRDFPA